MGFKVTRKTFKMGYSHAVTLPASWCQFYGDRIDTLTIVGNGVLIVAPRGLEQLATRMIESAEKEGALA